MRYQLNLVGKYPSTQLDTKMLWPINSIIQLYPLFIQKERIVFHEEEEENSWV